ncbi:Zn-ribbon domain-containing OB-fold protein [Papillibacter cinnamivorans]|uniref:Zn-ribbon domain-containing OB-fold protein n=1 Tax=Papillibacter cinnamivorans TaxID=100176 RepID=UPI001356665C|nr:OB-fold domain-containing protein [Papillibacter cinnamivorans]
MYKDGRIYSYSIINAPVEKFSAIAPYLIVIVDDGEKRFLVRIEAFEKDKPVGIGDPVKFDRLDEEGSPVYILN